jgi:gas vesicle protein
MWQSVLTLAGVIVGALTAVLTSLLTARASSRSAERIASRTLVHEQLKAVRQSAAEAFSDGLRAATEVHSVYVEDSVLGTQDGQIRQRVQEAMPVLDRAQNALNGVAAASVHQELADAALEVAALLAQLRGAWEDACGWAAYMHSDRSKKAHFESLFWKAVARLDAARTELLGYSEDTPSEEMGKPLAGKLLVLRDAVRSSGPAES